MGTNLTPSCAVDSVRNMNVLFFEPMAIWTAPHFETCLELMQGHLDRGDRVTFLGCSAGLESCVPNFHHERRTCLRCVSKRDRGLALLDRAVRVCDFRRLTAEDRAALDELRTAFTDIEDLKSYTVDGFDAGYAAASSLITFVKDPSPDMNKHGGLRGKAGSRRFRGVPLDYESPRRGAL